MKTKFKIKKQIPEFLFNIYIERDLKNRDIKSYNENEYNEEVKKLKKWFKRHLFGYKIIFETSEFSNNILKTYGEEGLETLYSNICVDLIENGIFYYLYNDYEKKGAKNGQKTGFLYCYRPIFGKKDEFITFNNWEDANLNIYTIHPFMKESEQYENMSQRFKEINESFCVISFEDFDKDGIHAILKPFSIINQFSSVLDANIGRNLKPGNYGNNLKIIGFDTIDTKNNRILDMTNQNDVGSINSYLFSSNFVVESSPNFTFKLPNEEEMKDTEFTKKLPYKTSFFLDALNENKVVKDIYKKGIYMFDNFLYNTPIQEVRNLNNLRPDEITYNDRMRWRVESCLCGSGSLRERCTVREKRDNMGYKTRFWESSSYMSFKCYFEVSNIRIREGEEPEMKKVICGYIIFSLHSANQIKRKEIYDEFRPYEILYQKDINEVYSKLG